MNYYITLFTFNNKTNYKEILTYFVTEDIAKCHIDALCYCLKFELIHKHYIVLRYYTFDCEYKKILDFDFIKDYYYEKN